MRVAVLTREYPPEVYGGAGVHVEFLVRELRRLIDVDVHCFGADRATNRACAPTVRLPALADANAALQTLGRGRGDGRGAGRRRRAALAHLVRQPGRRPRRAAARRAARADARTRWSRSGRGRPSSSAAATGSRPGPSGRHTRRPTRSSRCRLRHAGRRARGLPVRRPDARVHVIHNGIDTELYAPATPAPTCWRGTASTWTGRR